MKPLEHERQVVAAQFLGGNAPVPPGPARRCKTGSGHARPLMVRMFAQPLAADEHDPAHAIARSHSPVFLRAVRKVHVL